MPLTFDPTFYITCLKTLSGDENLLDTEGI